MMHRTLLLSLLGFTVATFAAPTSIDAATLLQNGEEAQALNRYFKSLKAADPCQDGQVACLGTRTIAKCEGTTWETTLGQCSRSQDCFALPSVSSGGARITCTSEKSAENLITATGAVGGIFGNPANGTMEVSNGGSTQRNPDASSASYITSPSTLVSDFTPGATSALPSPSSGANVPGDRDADTTYGSTTSRGPCTIHDGNANATPSQPTPTVVADTPPSTSTNSPSSISATRAPDVPSPSDAGQPRVTVTVTLVPSQPTTLPPQTRTISPQDAAAVISSVNAADGSVSPSYAQSSSAAPYSTDPASVTPQAASSSAPASLAPTHGGSGGY